MHSLNQPVLAQAIANELHARYAGRVPSPRRPERPPGPPLRGRAAYAAGRLDAGPTVGQEPGPDR